MIDTKSKKQERNIAYGVLDMRHGDKLDVAEKQVKQAMEISPTEFYFDLLHTANQTPTALAWQPEIEAMIEALSPRDHILAVVRLTTDGTKLRARNELYKKAYQSNTKVAERSMS
jgi:hypothetical protein